MRKILVISILILAFVPFLTRKNDYVDVTSVINVSSICIDYDEEADHFSLYFYVLNNFNLAQAELSSSNVDTLAYITKINDTDFTLAFEKFRKISNVFVHYNHLKTVILTSKFISKSQNVEKFYQFVRNNLDIYPTFYLFTTDCKVEEIFQIKTFSDISANFTLLINPKSSKTYELITFIDFIKAMNVPSYTLKIPHIASAKETSNKQDEPYKSIILDGYTMYNVNQPVIQIIEDKLSYLHWLSELNNLSVSIGDYSIYIKEGKYKIKKKQNQITITYTLNSTITRTSTNFINEESYATLKASITKELEMLYTYGKENDIDFFNLKYLLHTDTLDDVKFIVQLTLG